jgi:hypothetical protein
MLLACEAKSKAFEWIWTALPQLQAYVATVQTGVNPGGAGLIVTALQTHFRLDSAQAVDMTFLQPIVTNLVNIERYLHRAPELFKFATLAECEAGGMILFQIGPDGHFVTDATGNKVPVVDAEGNHVPAGAAFTGFNTGTTITPSFAQKGEACRAAQIIHEAGHFVDADNDGPKDIPEWYVTQPTATALGLAFQGDRDDIEARYDQMPPERARHNPSSYVSFCAHIRYLSDVRYGELRQDPVPGVPF